MSITTERLVLSCLCQDETYMRKVLPFLKSEYFHDRAEKEIFDTIHTYIRKYEVQPNRTTLSVDIQTNEKLNSKESAECEVVIRGIFEIDPPSDNEWLLSQTEEFCRQKAVYNSIMKAIAVYDGSEKSISPHTIPDMIKDAISVNFDTHIGMDLYDDAGDRYDYYSAPKSKIPFDIQLLNDCTNGGIGRKTLNVVVAAVNAGKTMALIHLACGYARDGHNVLYFTMEMREEEILRRIDANMLKTPINKLNDYSRNSFVDKIEEIRAKSYGQIKVKEYAPGAAHADNFKYVIDELKLKKKFFPDIIIVDYIGITGSSRIKAGSQNSYFYLKSVAEELRALAVETNSAVFSASQLNRSGMSTTDIEMTDIAESMGIAQSADFVFAVARTEELDSMGQVLVKQLKNRYGNKSNPRFVVGVDLDRQTLYDVGQSEQDDLIQMKPSATSTTSLKDKFKQLNGE